MTARTSTTKAQADPTSSEQMDAVDPQADREESETFFRLPTGGWVEIIDIDDVTNAQRQQLRKALHSTSEAGESTNQLYNKAMAMFIVAWRLVKPAAVVNADIPARNPRVVEMLTARDAQAIERRLRTIVELITDKDDSDPKAGRSSTA
jgi:hypothetical protein